MTELLENALEKVSELSEQEQNEIATLILQEITDEERWQKSFANSKTQLKTLAEEALKEYKESKTSSFPE